MLAVDTGLAGFVILTASFVVACGIIWRAFRGLAREVRRLNARLQRLHDLSDPDDD